jgi:sentrin-specific protease 1
MGPSKAPFRLVKRKQRSVPRAYLTQLNHTQLLRSYCEAESMDKKKKPFDFTGWEDYVPKVRKPA